MRTIGVVTVARSDYGIYQPLLRRIQADPDLNLCLIVAGTHFSPEFGLTAREIEADGYRVGAKVEMLLSSDTPTGIAKSMGLGTIGFAQAFEQERPDILVVLGDRFETHAAVVAALPLLIPVAHIAGGAVTVGAIDDSLRHSITKMSHIHFAEIETFARRLIQMGEEPWRVVTTGALGLDSVRETHLFSLAELSEHFDLSLDRPPLLVTFHPVTREYGETASYACELLAALDQFDLPIIFTYPCADTNGRVLIRMISDFVAGHDHAQAVANLGMRGYLSLMQHSVAMVGNSSSGIVEAPSFKLPVVNIGDRQKGRILAQNVINVGYGRDQIAYGISKAMSRQFQMQLDNLVNPYGDGHATEKIVQTLKTIRVDSLLVTKNFHDWQDHDSFKVPREHSNPKAGRGRVDD